MLLRRVIEHVRDQNWTAVGIDFVIVVVGVFIGIQVANWNEQRADRARTGSYLERITEDLASDILRIDAEISFRRGVAMYGKQALHMAAQPHAEADPWEVILAFFQASQAGSLEVADTTYAELTSTGDLRLIDDFELRRNLSAYYTTGSFGNLLGEQPQYRSRVRSVIPLGLQSHIWQHCYETGVGGAAFGQRTLPCARPGETGDIAAPARLLLGDEELHGLLRYWVSAQDVMLLVLEDRRQSAVQLREQVRLRI